MQSLGFNLWTPPYQDDVLEHDADEMIYPDYYMGEGMKATTIAATATAVIAMMLIWVTVVQTFQPNKTIS